MAVPGEVAGRVGVSCLNGRDPCGSSWGRRLGGLGVLSKWERRPRWFLGEAAGRVGMSRLNGRDPHSGSWGRRLGGLGCPV